MAFGSIQTIVVCMPSDSTQLPCPSGQSFSVVKGYLVDPNQAVALEAQNAPFDYEIAASIWGFAFTFVVGLYLVSRSAGAIIGAIRSF